MVDQAEINRLAQSRRSEDRKDAAESLGASFYLVPDKDKAWMDLHRLTEDQDINVRWSAARALGWAFCHIPDRRPNGGGAPRCKQEGHARRRRIKMVLNRSKPFLSRIRMPFIPSAASNL